MWRSGDPANRVNSTGLFEHYYRIVVGLLWKHSWARYQLGVPLKEGDFVEELSLNTFIMIGSAIPSAHVRKMLPEEEWEHERAVPIILFQDHKFQLDEEALKKIILKDDIKDRPVVVLSVAGAFRKGKSFLLNFFLRYMDHAYGGSVDGDADWIGSDDQPLKGFSWKGGSERDTTGILMWSKVYQANLPTGEKVAIVLLDTQGTFDSGSTVRECATVFALSTLISSIQIYNLSQNIQEDDLQHLQLFLDYGRLALLDSGQVPFQRLMFLIRDWYYPYEAEYGELGGQKFLNKRLRVSANQAPELQSTRRRIKSCFSDISCFLMPFPGNKVTTNPDFDGKLSDIDEEFQSCLRELVDLLLAPEKLLVKEICGQKIKAKELVQYFQSYTAVYSGDELPEPKTLLAATAEANNLSAVAAAKEVYISLMEETCGSSKPHMTTSVLNSEHNRVKIDAIKEFHSKRKMGGEEFSETYRIKLEADLDEMFGQFKRVNQMKGAPTYTPAVFLIITTICYVVSGILGLLGLYALANLCSLVMFGSLLTVATWMYAKACGGMEELGEGIDSISYAIWEGAFKPTYLAAINKAARKAVTAAGTSGAPRLATTTGQPSLKPT